jgi:hypothetical protein
MRSLGQRTTGAVSVVAVIRARSLPSWIALGCMPGRCRSVNATHRLWANWGRLAVPGEAELLDEELAQGDRSSKRGNLIPFRKRPNQEMTAGTESADPRAG